MNDNIAMAAVFKSRMADTIYTESGPEAGQVAEIKLRWGWKAENLDSLRVRYPKVQIVRAETGPIPVYYSIGDVYETTKQFDIAYVGEITTSPKIKGDLGTNHGKARFLKDEKGWYLADNVYNTQAPKLPATNEKSGEATLDKQNASSNERMFTLHWSREGKMAYTQPCQTQMYRNFTAYGSYILEVPRGQIWIPVAGESRPSAASQLYTWVQIEADDDNPYSGCYFGTIRKVPKNLRKNVALAKDEFHKYYGGTKLRFWGQSPYNEITMLVIGPGSLPMDTGLDRESSHATRLTPRSQSEQRAEAPDTVRSTDNTRPISIFRDTNSEQHFTGNVGNLQASYSLTLVNNIITGSYYYPKRPTKNYALTGTLKDDGTMILGEYTGETRTATCTLTPSGNCYEGRMQNSDGRTFKMSICR